MELMINAGGGTEVNASNMLGGNIQTGRLLKIFDQQVRRIAGQQFYAVAGMREREFTSQTETLRHELESGTFLASGNMHLVLCLPQRGKLETRIARSRNCRDGSRCKCHPYETKDSAHRDKLHALVGVSDGCSCRLLAKASQTSFEELDSRVAPHQTMSIWSILDMTFLYPSLADQQGFVSGQSLAEGFPTVLWVKKDGTLTFAGTSDQDFRNSKKTRWGVPSFNTLVTI